MAMIKCPECGKEMSDFTKICLSCGYPISEHLNKKKKLEKLNQDFEERLQEIESVEIADKPTFLQTMGAASCIILLFLGCSIFFMFRFLDYPSYYVVKAGKAYPSYYFAIAFAAVSVILLICFIIVTAVTRKRNIKRYMQNEERKKQFRKEQVVRQYEEYKNKVTEHTGWGEIYNDTSEDVTNKIFNEVMTIKHCLQFFVILAVIGIIGSLIIIFQ